jgi:hypothetical protein
LRKRAKDDFMNTPDGPDPDMLDEYDFGNARRGRYAQRFAEGTNVVLLDPDVVAEFGDSRQVNDALRELLALRNKAG